MDPDKNFDANYANDREWIQLNSHSCQFVKFASNPLFLRVEPCLSLRAEALDHFGCGFDALCLGVKSEAHHSRLERRE